MIPETLRSSMMFSSFSEADLDSINGMTHVVKIPKGSALFQQAQEFRHFYYLTAGIIKLTRTAEDGTEKIIEFIRAGSYFAEALAFLHSPHYPVRASAVRDCELISIDAEQYLRLLKGSTDTCFNLLASMSRRIHYLVNEIDSLTLHTSKSRVAGYLADCLHIGSQKCFKLDMPKAMIASRLSMKPETLSRALHSLEKESIIEIDRSYITVNDAVTLQQIANQERECRPG